MRTTVLLLAGLSVSQRSMAGDHYCPYTRLDSDFSRDGWNGSVSPRQPGCANLLRERCLVIDETPDHIAASCGHVRVRLEHRGKWDYRLCPPNVKPIDCTYEWDRTLHE